MRLNVSSYSGNMGLNETEILVLATKIYRYQEDAALEYLKKKGCEMSRATYYRTLGHIEGETRKRLHEIARGMNELHMERIDELEKVRTAMWEQYKMEEIPILKVRILKEIKELQPYISAYHESTKDILEDTIRRFANEESIAISNLSK